MDGNGAGAGAELSPLQYLFDKSNTQYSPEEFSNISGRVDVPNRTGDKLFLLFPGASLMPFDKIFVCWKNSLLSSGECYQSSMQGICISVAS